jgi:predicted O-methyltransferase YrrM
MDKLSPLTSSDFQSFKYQDGEMTPFERFKLYSWVKQTVPINILEVGTGTGASTFYLAHALAEVNPHAMVYTCDPSRAPTDKMLSDFPNICYSKITSGEQIDRLEYSDVEFDFVFFDGPEDPMLALNDFKRLEPTLKAGTHFAMHDWEFIPRKLDGQRSMKAAALRPYIERSTKWKLVECLSGLKANSDMFPLVNGVDSVGLCLYQLQ